MSQPIVKSLADEQLEDILKLPRETLVFELDNQVKGDWPLHARDNSSFMEGDWGFDPRGRLVEM
ncbi:hypothetical protein AABC73_15100 [Pseudomonas sp. G.S.17]|uniref:hypothetical protein n=1 Tax=Pseudomonas sp. G.S.17 TaxID=3137451 RepID=UPI00311CA293